MGRYERGHRKIGSAKQLWGTWHDGARVVAVPSIEEGVYVGCVEVSMAVVLTWVVRCV
jgi:hypothetical protein